MFWGALAQSIPDIDFITSFWMNTPESLLAHRGFTHSVSFALLIIPIMALAADKVHKPHNIAFRTWLVFFTAEILLHLFIDGYNNYGVGWFEPFSHARYSFNALYVADPLFSIWPVMAFLVLLFLNRYSTRRKFWWRTGMILPLIYMSYCTFNKFKINKDVKQILSEQQIPHKRYFTTPAPLQNWLWYVVAGNDTGYYVGFRSLFDSKKQIAFEYFPKNAFLMDTLANHEELQKLVRFSQNYYTVEKWGDTLVFNDLRFGQIIGWQNPKEKFVFHYFLQHPEDNRLVVQRGRFHKWDKNTVKSFIRRIKGN